MKTDKVIQYVKIAFLVYALCFFIERIADKRVEKLVGKRLERLEALLDQVKQHEYEQK